MKPDISIQDLLFGVDQVPVEAVIGTNGHTRRINIPGKKALINKRSGQVLGVVSRDYRVVTNQEAVDIARDACGIAFPGVSPLEWEAKRVSTPRTLSYAHIDLMHRTHVLNYWDNEIQKDDPFTPFLRVTNSFNGARALRFDIGFMRKHCSNGVIFEEEVATIKASHRQEALDQLKIEVQSRSLPMMGEEFSHFLTRIRGLAMDIGQSTLALNSVLRLPAPKPDDKPAPHQGLNALSADFTSRLSSYRKELGPNAYAVFNTLTDIAARSPESAYFLKTRDTIEKRAGRWLKDLVFQSHHAGFDLNAWVPSWDASGSVQKIPVRN
jgi:hypothetical protein